MIHILLITILEFMKQHILNALWPLGKKATILMGHLRGFKYIVTENSAWSPIFGRYETDTQAMLSSVVKPGMVVYDLGANAGIHSLLFSKLTTPNGIVFCFEPLPSNCAEIHSNLLLNDLKNVRVVCAAVGESAGKAKFKLAAHDKEGSLVGIGAQTGETIDVDVISLDRFIAEGNPVPDLIKIDIEGAESMALNGFEASIDRYKPILFIELHTPEQDKLVGDFLTRHQYKAYRRIKSRDNDLCRNDLQLIKDLNTPYPAPEGIWGNILCCHESKIKLLSNCAI
jgi:FkbM family methyltransferase